MRQGSPPGRRRGRKRKRQRAENPRPPTPHEPRPTPEYLLPNSVQQHASSSESDTARATESASAREEILRNLTWRSLLSRPYATLLFVDFALRKLPIWIASFVTLHGATQVHHYAVSQVSQAKLNDTTQPLFTVAIQAIIVFVMWRLARRD